MRPAEKPALGGKPFPTLGIRCVELLDELCTWSTATLVDVPVGADLRTLRLERVLLPTGELSVHVDGLPSSLAPPASLSVWSGRVDGDPDSDVWLSLSAADDLDAAQAYMLALLGGVNVRFREQVGVILAPRYIGFWTTPADPWLEPDREASCELVRREVCSQWDNGAAPVRADLYDMLSGAQPRDGCAHVGDLCNRNRNYGVRYWPPSCSTTWARRAPRARSWARSL